MIIQHLANLPSSCPSDSSSLESCASALKSSISALESSLKTTEGSSGHWETFGWLCAVAVGIGIAGEIVVIVSEHVEGLKDWESGIIRPPDRPPAWRFWFDIAATLIVLGGVFGEAVATAKVTSINSQLRSKTSELRAKSDQLLAVITEESGDAANSADRAVKSADRAKKVADAADTRAKSVETTAKKLDGRLTTTGQKLDTVEGKRAELETALKNMATCLSPRVITFLSWAHKGKAATTVDSLKQYARDVSIEYIPSDAEANRAAVSLKKALHAAGWNVTDFSPKEGIDEGVEVQYALHSMDDWDAANSVVDFLQALNWQAQTGFPLDDTGTLIRDPKAFPPTSVRIRVGMYPAVMYAVPHGMESSIEAVNAIEEEIKKSRAEIYAKGQKAEEEDEAKFLSQFPPERAAQYKARFEQKKKEEKEREALNEKRRLGPCQPLASIPYLKF